MAHDICPWAVDLWLSALGLQNAATNLELDPDEEDMDLGHFDEEEPVDGDVERQEEGDEAGSERCEEEAV